jgi:hypothetical protein
MRPNSAETASATGIPVEHGFGWRTALAPWRWWLLGSLGVASSACESREQLLVWRMGPKLEPSACVFESSLGGGWERCANGMLHRTSAGVCPSVLPRPGYVDLYMPPVPEADAGADAGLGADAAAPPISDPYSPFCLRDSDCTAKPYGHCEWFSTYVCEYGCATDADCASGESCVCGEVTGECRPASCLTDAECDPGALCGSYSTLSTCYSVGSFSCQSADDECAGDTDCLGGESCSRALVNPRDPAGARQARRTCESVACPVIGRPFLVAGAERLAALVERRDWYTAAGAGPADVMEDPVLQAALARAWAEQARMEHASVAAFARFTLQLLGLGAPAELVAGAARAMQDEIRHARACFELARRYSDRDVGPAALELDNALGDSDLCSVVLGTLREGCIGETIAAIEAREALLHCEDPDTCALLRQIAAEEAQHAELAWRFVAWGLEVGPASLRESVRSLFADALGEPRTARTETSPFDLALLRHGSFGVPLRHALRERVLAEVIGPCAEALLANVAVAPGASARVSSSAESRSSARAFDALA